MIAAIATTPTHEGCAMGNDDSDFQPPDEIREPDWES